MMLNMMLVFDDFEDGAEFRCLCWILMVWRIMLDFEGFEDDAGF